MRHRTYEAKDPRIGSTINRCESIGIKIGLEQCGKTVQLFTRNRYLNVEQTALLNHLNFEGADR